jgi:hypothetical protein
VLSLKNENSEPRKKKMGASLHAKFYQRASQKKRGRHCVLSLNNENSEPRKKKGGASLRAKFYQQAS